MPATLLSFATIAALTASSTTGLSDGDLAHVTDTNRGGYFRWNPSDLANRVVWETTGYVCVFYAPDSDIDGSSGAWVRQAYYDGDAISIKWAGAVGDGTTDNKNAIQAAMLFAARSTGSLFAPAGIYRTAGRLEFDHGSDNIRGIEFTGVMPSVTVGASPNVPATGTWLHFDHLDYGITFRDDEAPGNSNKFFRLSKLGFCRSQPTPATSWTPVAHNADIRVEYSVIAEDLVHLNSTKGYHVRSAGTLQVSRVRGQFFNIGFEVERSSDVQRFHDIHAWPYWSADANVIGYTIDNLITVKARRADGLKVSDLFSIYHHRLALLKDESGDLSGAAGFSFERCYSDGAGGGIEIQCDHYRAYGSITDFLHNCDASLRGTGPAIHIHGSQATNITILDHEVTRAMDECLLVDGAAHTVIYLPRRLAAWNRSASSHASIKADGGATIELLRIPDTDGNGSLYSTGSNGVITFPTRFALNRSAASAAGFLSRRFTVANDTVATYAMPKGDYSGNISISPVSSPSNDNPAIIFWARATANPVISKLVSTPANPTNFVLTTGALTGTSGAVGNVTMSVHTDGLLYIENRSGSSRSYNLTLFGG